MAEEKALRRLRAEIALECVSLERRCVEVERYARDPGPLRAPELDAALALALDRTYSALESLLERIVRNLEGSLPAGADWHRALLDDAGLAIDQVRPAILAEASVVAAHQLRRFRHFLRHAYSVDLDAARLRDVARLWLDAWPQVRSDLEAFDRFLAAAADALRV